MSFKPARYKHGCKSCFYLGQFGQHDLYFCNQAGLMPTVIARASDEEQDYKSGMEFARIDPDLAEAKIRAWKMGLINEFGRAIATGIK